MSLYDQRLRQGVTDKLIFTNKRRGTQFTHHPMVARLASCLVGLAALVLGLATAGILVDVPQPEPNPMLPSGQASASAEPETRSYLKLAVIGQNLLAEYHPESGTSIAVRSPVVEIRRGV